MAFKAAVNIASLDRLSLPQFLPEFALNSCGIELPLNIFRVYFIYNLCFLPICPQLPFQFR